MNPLGFLGRPFDESGAVNDLALCFAIGLAHLQRDQRGEIADILHDQLVPLHEKLGALEGRGLLPALEGLACGSHRLAGALGTKVRDIRKVLAIGRIGHSEGLRSGRPVTGDEAVGAEQGLVLETIGNTHV